MSRFTNHTDGIPGPPGPKGDSGESGASALYYGSFYSTQTQSMAQDEIKSITLNNTDLSNGIVVESSSHIKILNAGKYNIAFSAQLHNTGGGGQSSNTNIWLSKNGIDIPDTNTRVSVNSNSPYVVAAWNFFVNALANDYFELKWSTNNANVEIDYSTPNTHPAIPSVILTVNQVG